MPVSTSPSLTKKSIAVKTMAMAVNIIKNFFLALVKSAIVPKMGDMSATRIAATPTEIPHNRVPSAPPTTAFLKYAE